MGKDVATVYIVDDEITVSTALARSLTKRGYRVQTFESAESFLERFEQDGIACLVLDIQMAGMSGTDLQEHLAALEVILPIIFVTGHGDIPMSVRAIKAGAVDFLEKPYPVELLTTRIDDALKQCELLMAEAARKREIVERYDSLTPRECDVMKLLVAGAANASNKVIARELEISHRTVDDHRARVMAKMKARSLPELVEMAKDCNAHTEEVPMAPGTEEAPGTTDARAS